MGVERGFGDGERELVRRMVKWRVGSRVSVEWKRGINVEGSGEWEGKTGGDGC
jgi:hypothetical protein